VRWPQIGQLWNDAALCKSPEFGMSGISLADANKVINAAIATARAKGFKPMAVVVLDESGHLRACQREDGASMFRVEVATGKAWASVGMGAASRELLERAKQNPIFFGGLAVTAQGKFLAQTGAVLIKAPDGQVIGAAGASGGTGDEDELICIEGVKAAGLHAA
jgi:uncharacterized protein GlcG (DUF336 family)